MRSAFIALSFLAAFFLASCRRIPPEYRAFLDLPLSKQHEVLKKLPIEKRIEYYLAAMQYNEPPGVGLADDVAQEGKQALPFLMKRLREEKDEHNQVHLIRVFEFMHGHYYRLKDETEVLSLLRQTTDNMKDPWCKERGEEALKYIQTDQLPDVEKTLGDLNKRLSKQ